VGLGLGISAGAPFALVLVLASACFVTIDESRLFADASAESGTPASDAGATDAAVGPVLVPCGDGGCAPPIGVCCASTYGDTDYRRGACSTGDRCATGDYFRCTRGHDCQYPGSAGPLCCVVRLTGGAFTQTVCASDCDGGDVLCAEGDEASCPAGHACTASLEFPVLFECAK
jgi:hypothetical protein